MAVGANSLGQHVRCPHCQQVVLVPATITPLPAPAPQPAPASPVAAPAPTPGEQLEQTQISVPAVSEIESIFASPESNSDALFGGPPRGLVEMPPPDPLPPPAADLPNPTPPGPPLLGPVEPTMTYHAGAARSDNGAEATTEADPAAFHLGPPAAGADEAASTEIDTEALARAIPKPQIRPPVDRGGWLIALLVVPLISYSILATIAVVYLRFFYAAPTMQPHPLEMIPDVEGDNPGATRVKKKVSGVNFHGRQERELPDRLRTTLQQPIRIGDLEVTPVSVQFRTIEFIIRDKDPVASETPCLVLNLHLKNVSKGVAFHPLDPYFVRRWKEIKGESKSGMPFTYLIVGKERFYGGPISVAEREERQETIKGQRLGRELKPGDEMDTFICSSPEDPVKEAVEANTQPMLWRVQVRRGFVETPNRGERPASAVIGVEFTRDDILMADRPKRGEM
jgi:hypothetical protein